MTILDYTDATTVRALLGVNPIELKDTVIMLPPYILAVEYWLDKADSTLQAKYLAVKAIPEASRTTLENRLFYQVQTYSALLVAVELMPTLPMFAPKSIEDGKAKLDRIADPYTTLQESLLASSKIMVNRILDTLAKLDPSITVSSKVIRNFAAAIPLAIDPVTGA